MPHGFFSYQRCKTGALAPRIRTLMSGSAVLDMWMRRSVDGMRSRSDPSMMPLEEGAGGGCVGGSSKLLLMGPCALKRSR